MKKALTGVIGALATGVAAFALAEKNASKGNCNGTPECLLILGSTVHGETPCEILKARIKTAGEYLLENKNVIAIPCGGIVQKDRTKSEASVIADSLVEMGVERERIFLEDKSTTTEENFKNAREIILSIFDGKIPKTAFLSSEFHLMRANVIAKKQGFDFETIPSETPKSERFKAYVRELIVFPFAL